MPTTALRHRRGAVRTTTTSGNESAAPAMCRPCLRATLQASCRLLRGGFVPLCRRSRIRRVAPLDERLATGNRPVTWNKLPAPSRGTSKLTARDRRAACALRTGALYSLRPFRHCDHSVPPSLHGLYVPPPLSPSRHSLPPSLPPGTHPLHPLHPLHPSRHSS